MGGAHVTTETPGRSSPTEVTGPQLNVPSTAKKGRGSVVADAPHGQIPAPVFATALVDALPKLRRTAAALGRRQAEIEDLVQATCLRAMERRAQFAPGTNILGWLVTILRNLHVDSLRRVRAEHISAVPVEACSAPEPEPEEASWLSLTSDDVADAAERLSASQRSVFVLHFFGHKSYAQIAERLDIPMATVASRLYRARAELRRLFTIEPLPAPRPESGASG